jgi:hypothetical protein
MMTTISHVIDTCRYHRHVLIACLQTQLGTGGQIAMAGTRGGRSLKVPWYLRVYQWSLKNKELVALAIILLFSVYLMIFGG